MKQLLTQTNALIKWNLRRLAVFLILCQLVAGTFYIGTVNALLRAALKAAGYSYLTPGNAGAFLLKPLTFPYVLFLLLLGMAVLLFEISGVVYTYYASSCSRRVEVLEIFKGALETWTEQIKEKNWQLLFVSLGGTVLMNSVLLLRIFSRMKPFDFILYEILHTRVLKYVLAGSGAALVLAAIPSMFVFFACMVEQKSFSDGIRRSRELLKGHRLTATGLLLWVNLLLFGMFFLVYTAVMALLAVFVTLFAARHAALAVLTEVGTRLEMLLLFAASCAALIGNFGALTVLYLRFSGEADEKKHWGFSRTGSINIKRKTLRTVSGVLAVISAFLLFDMAHNGAFSDWSPLGTVEITAHRGSSKRAPENTMAAIEAAMEEMADYSEIDVQLTKDGQVVVCHDLNAKRVAGVNRRIGKMTLDEVEALDVGSSFGKEYKGEKIPTLEEVLKACKGRMNLNIELKNIGSHTDLPEKTAQLISEYHMEDQCVISSVRLSYLKEIKEINPELKTGYILAAAYGYYYENDDIDFISIRSSFVTKKMVEAAHENGKAVHVWTVNKKSELEEMKRLGVDNIITDDPARAREVLYQEEGTKNLMEYLRMALK